MKCPRCGSRELRKPSATDSRLKQVIRVIVLPIRCYWCGHEFYRPTAMTDDLRATPGYRVRRAA
jgi:DNA-directed RNA polymerase subunit RPC12/RpoP